MLQCPESTFFIHLQISSRFNMPEEFQPYGFAPKRIDIPPIFHSLLTDGLFQSCVECERPLLADAVSGDNESRLVPYFVDRVFRGTEPIVEYAMCLPCREKMCSELSKESTQRIQAYTEERVVLEDRLAMVGEDDWDDLDKWLGKCLITKEPREGCNEYQVVAACFGDQMIIGPTPYMISGTASREVSKLLSKKTRDRMGDFMNTHFGMPPEFADNPNAPMMF